MFLLLEYLLRLWREHKTHATDDADLGLWNTYLPSEARQHTYQDFAVPINGQATRMTAVVEAESLTKRFGEVAAVTGLSFALKAGTITGFLGPNGAGKTTTLRMVWV